MHYNYPINIVNENHFKWKKQVNKMYNGMIMLVCGLLLQTTSLSIIF